MSKLQYQEYYRRHLPHFQPRGFTFFITFRLANSLPHEIVVSLVEETRRIERSHSIVQLTLEAQLKLDEEWRRLFEKWDDALHSSKCGEWHLKDDRVAAIVAKSIRFHDKDWFVLEAYSIMPNHVHLVLTPRERSESLDYSLAEIMHNIKRNSAKQANLILNRSGSFWQHESYDHVVRDDAELERIVDYTLDNPVKAGLAADWADWPWSYSKTESEV